MLIHSSLFRLEVQAHFQSSFSFHLDPKLNSNQTEENSFFFSSPPHLPCASNEKEKIQSWFTRSIESIIEIAGRCLKVH